MRTVAIVQARMGSTRLPGKVLKALGDRTVLGHVIHRLQAIVELSDITIATTTSLEDDKLVAEAKKYGVRYYRGSESDVLSRYFGAAVECKSDNIVRITSDCPVIDPVVTADVIRFFIKQQADYASNGLERSFPRGLDTEVFTMDSLTRAYRHAEQEFQREHVTPYLYQNPHLFILKSYINPVNYSQYRWTLDTEEDWAVINEIYKNLYQPGKIFLWQDIVKLMEDCPRIPLLNVHVEQKKLGT